MEESFFKEGIGNDFIYSGLLEKTGRNYFSKPDFCMGYTPV
ncbi:hypothetical protein JOC76_004765 [Neobacillus cucumis]|nr:hypothetical protein [Neobacillus cucumis]